MSSGQPTKSTEMPFGSESSSSGLAPTEQLNTSSNGGNDSNAAATKKSEAEEAADRLYEERIEEEYAKREGGA